MHECHVDAKFLKMRWTDHNSSFLSSTDCFENLPAHNLKYLHLIYTFASFLHISSLPILDISCQKELWSARLNAFTGMPARIYFHFFPSCRKA